MTHFDFEFFLVIAAAVTGLLWLIDALFFARGRKPSESGQKRKERLEIEAAGQDRSAPLVRKSAQKDTIKRLEIEATGQNRNEPLVIEYSRAFFPVLLAVLVLRAFMFEPFRIPSGSMMPSLLVGDFILVDKFSYGLRLPVTHTRVTAGDLPKRGDVIVFRYPKDESQDYIKRVIGLPGDRVSYYNRRLSVNGVALDTTPDRIYQGLGDLNQKPGASGCDRPKAQCQVLIESTGEVEYTVMTNPAAIYSADGEVTVPEGHYFVMGDNRDHSNDSRFWGYVPEENLVGKAIRVWMHWDWDEGGNGLDLSRIGRKISQ